MLKAEDFTVQNSEFLIRRGWRMWSRHDLFEGKMLLLCPKADYKNVPRGTRMTDVFGEHHVKGKDKINSRDEKGGTLAYGILLEDIIVPDEKKRWRSIDDA